MSKADFRCRQARRRRHQMVRASRHSPILIVLLAITLLVGGGVLALYRFVIGKQPSGPDSSVQAVASAGCTGSPQDSQASPPSSAEDPAEVIQDDTSRMIALADRTAMGYDYDKAIQLINGSGLNLNEIRIQEALARYEQDKAVLVLADMNSTTHASFHTLIMDTVGVFDGDKDSVGYNSAMTIKDEFIKILESMYARGYVLTRTHNIAHQEADEDGNMHFVKGNIMFPEGEKSFVMFRDDVYYCPYMDGDGFANKVVIREDDKPTCQMTMDDGTVQIGSFDLVPLLEDFVQERPDFSHKGARAITAFTGHEGILGYRTASSYVDSPTYETDREQAAKVTQYLRDNGWELASHNWGHLQLGVAKNPGDGFAISEERFKADTDKWGVEAESLTGLTDILLYPYGNDIMDWRPHKGDNPRFKYLGPKGFRYFCNVDASAPYWMQMGTSYLRIARRNLDGYRLYEDLVQTDPVKKWLMDLLDAAGIFDPTRPTPTSWNYQRP